MGTKQAENKGLSPKRQRFVEEYLKDFNGTQAAIRAGYAPKAANEQAARLLANASVRAAVDAGRELLRSEAVADAAELREIWTRIARSDKEETKDVLKATELLGKAQGMFVDRVKHEGAAFSLVVHGPDKK